MTPSPTEQAQNAIIARAQAARSLAEKYSRVFGTKDGQEVLADLCSMFPCDRARIDAAATKANPVAALIGGIHFDGSAAVTKYVLDRIEAAKAPAETVPTVTAP